MLVASWSEHLLQNERVTKEEHRSLERAWSLDVRPDCPVVKHFISVDKELLGGKRPEPCPLHKLATTTPFSLRTSLSAKISKAKDFFFVPTIT